MSSPVVLITGALTGIGRATALELGRMGANIVVAELDPGNAEGAAAEVRALGRRALVVPTDVTSRKDLEGMVERTRTEFGRIDILVCNAASNPYYGPMAGISDEQFRKIFENNVLANHWLIQMAAPGMLERTDGSCSIASVRSFTSSGANRPRA